MKIVYIPWTFSQCPVHWQNMINHLQARWDEVEDIDVADQDINCELAKFGGKYWPEDLSDGGRMVFETESAYTMFVLKWS